MTQLHSTCIYSPLSQDLIQLLRTFWPRRLPMMIEIDKDVLDPTGGHAQILHPRVEAVGVAAGVEVALQQRISLEKM